MLLRQNKGAAIVCEKYLPIRGKFSAVINGHISIDVWWLIPVEDLP